MVTHTTPSRAKRLPSYCGIALDPLEKAPPWIQTITGSPVRPTSGVQILRFKQSSPGIAGSGRIASKGGKYGGLGTVGPKLNASRTPFHRSTGWGGLKRLAPKGGAA